MQSGRKHSFQPGLECLEERSLMAAHLTASLSSGLLRIDGTDRADTIVVREIHDRISVDGVAIQVAGHGAQASVRVGAVSRIEVRGYGGDDRIYLNSEAVRGQQALRMPVAVWGGDGNDLIVGGAGPETLSGDAGNDQIYGGSGNDVLNGGAGDDVLVAGSGNSRLYGDAGNDKLFAGRGNDVLDGGAGHNLLVGGAGNDVFFSHSPSDILQQDRGHNTIHRLYPPAPHSVSPPPVHGLDFTPPPAAPAPTPFQAEINRIIASENAYRAGLGLNALTVNARLTAAAHYQANYMAATGHYDHINLDGRGLGDRAEAAGYHFSWVGENIHLYDPAIARTTGIDRYYAPSELAQYYFEGWQASPEHNVILTSPRALEIGVAITRAPSGLVYAVMVLGHL